MWLINLNVHLLEFTGLIALQTEGFYGRSYLGCAAGGMFLGVVWFPFERSGSDYSTQAMYQFSYYISKQGLIDPPLEGVNFTWSNSREVMSRSRLGRFLFTANWEDKFPSICLRRMSRLLSDYFPILLEGGLIHLRICG